MSTTRPLFECRIDELSLLFQQNKDDKEQLEQIGRELARRSGRRSKSLLSDVQDAIDAGSGACGEHMHRSSPRQLGQRPLGQTARRGQRGQLLRR